MTEICPTCSTTFDQQVLDGAAEANNLLIGTNIYQGVGYCSEECVEEYKKQLDPIKLKSRIDHTQIYTYQVTIPANENLVTIDVTDKVIASEIPPVDIMVIGTPDYPVALGIKGRIDAGRYYLDVGIIPQHTSEVIVTILAYATN